MHHSAPSTVDELRRSSVPAVLTATAAARVLGMDVRIINAALDNGELPYRRLGARRYIPRVAILQLAGVSDLVAGEGDD